MSIGTVERVPLSRERIVDAAIALVERRGLGGFTTRGLGTTLGCEAMSVYHHFPSKKHLQDAMVERVIGGIADPPGGLDPIDGLRFLGREFRAMAHRNPRLFPLVALHRLTPPAGIAFIERMLRHFHAALPDDRLAAQAFHVFGYFVVGAALAETSGYAEGPSSAALVTDETIVREAPWLAAAAPYFKRPYFDSTFESGLQIVLKGIADQRASLLASQRAPKPVVRPKA